jgi:low temperature requirement protein LtrA
MHVCRTGVLLWTLRKRPQQFRNYQRIAAWLILSGIFWLAGGFAKDGARVALWSIAIVIEFISPLVRFWLPVWGSSSLDDWQIEGAHMAERCGLFIIIVVGESILVTGSIFSGLVWNGANVAAFVVSFVGSLLLWWLYFDRSAEAASRVIAEAPDPGRLARSTYTYSHVTLVAGIILLAVSDQFVLSQPAGQTSIQTICALLGGTAFYLIGNLLIKWQVWHRVRTTHVIGLILLALLIPAATILSPLWMSIATTLILVAIAAGEQYYYRRNPIHFPEAAVAPLE